LERGRGRDAWNWNGEKTSKATFTTEPKTINGKHVKAKEKVECRFKLVSSLFINTKSAKISQKM
jgi:hypothetical protein